MKSSLIAPVVFAIWIPCACTMVRTREAPPAPIVAAPTAVDAPVIPSDAFDTLDAVGQAHGQLCQPDDQHPNFPNDADLLTKQFCQDLVPGGVMPTPHGLADLQALLGLDFKDPTGQNGVGGNPAFAVLGHSSALTARKISSITPTTFIFTPPPADGSAPTGQYALLGFDPGEQFAEVAVRDLATGSLNFYVVMFDQACTSSASGCTTTDLLTPRLVTGWSNVRVYEMTTALNDTIFDCHVCHQPDNSKGAILRMQEIEPPFTHWFSAKTTGGNALLSDFHAAHGTGEDYGGIPAAMIDQSDPSLLAAFLNQAGFGDQPNAFPSAAIEAEVSASQPAQPANNVPPGTSATWETIHENAVAGQFIATPYHDVKVTDPQKLATMTSAYTAWLSGSPADLPDLRDVFLDDGLRDMGFAPQLGLTGRELLVQMCLQCHDSKLDMTVSRELFLVDQLDQMSRQEKDLAITRIGLSTTTRLRMPPPLYRTMTDDERQLMIDELQK
jgi:hypothetical protein